MQATLSGFNTVWERIFAMPEVTMNKWLASLVAPIVVGAGSAYFSTVITSATFTATINTKIEYIEREMLHRQSYIDKVASIDTKVASIEEDIKEIKYALQRRTSIGGLTTLKGSKASQSVNRR